MNLKSLAVATLAVLASCLTAHADATCSSSTCGEAEYFELTFEGTGSPALYAGEFEETDTMQADIKFTGLDAGINGGQTEKALSSGIVYPATNLVAKTPKGTIKIRPETVYKGKILFDCDFPYMDLSGNTSGVGLLSGFFSVSNSCGWDLEVRCKTSINGNYSSWVKSGSCSGAIFNVNVDLDIEIHLVRKAGNQSGAASGSSSSSSTSAAPSPSDGGMSGATGLSPQGMTSSPSIPEEHRTAAPATGGNPPYMTPVGFHYSIPLGSKIGSRGYNVGTITMDGALSAGLVKMKNVVFANPGMPGVEVGKLTQWYTNPDTGTPEEVETVRQIHTFVPVLPPVMEDTGGQFGSIMDSALSPQTLENIKILNDQRSVSATGDLIDIRSTLEGIMIRYYPEGSFGEVVGSWPGTTGYTGIHALNGSPSKTILISPVPSGGGHVGGIRVTVTTPNQITRSTEYVNLSGVNAWRESTLANGVILESTDYDSNFEKTGGKWHRTDFKEVTRGGELYSKSSRTYLYQVEPDVDSQIFLESETTNDKNDSGITTTWVPHTSAALLGKPASMSRSDGYWEKYVYYTDTDSGISPEWIGMLKETLRPWNGAPASASLATTANSESTVLTYTPLPTDTRHPSSKGAGEGISVESIKTTRPSSSGTVTTSSWARSTVDEGPLISALISQLEDAGLDVKWKPKQSAISSNSSFQYVNNGNNEKLENCDFSYKWAPDIAADWVGNSFASLDEDRNGSATGYERGKLTFTSGTYTFTPNTPGALETPTSTWGNDTRSITINIINGGQPADNEATRLVVIRNSSGVERVREFSIKNGAGAWVVVSKTIYEAAALWPDGSLKQVDIMKDGRLAGSLRSEAAGYDFIKTERDEQGIETRTESDVLGRTTKITKVGIGNQPDVVTDYNYHGRTTEKTVTAGNTSRTTITVEDLLGRVTSVTNPSGAVVGTEYVGLETITTYPGGLKRYVTRKISGEIASITGSAEAPESVVPEYYTYETFPVPDSTTTPPGGYLRTTRRLGSLTSARKTITEEDAAGRTIRTAAPSPVGSGEVENVSEYWGNTRRLLYRTSPTGTFLSKNAAHNSLGILSGIDLDLDGDITLDKDRTTETKNYYVIEGGYGWQVTSNRVFDEENSGASAITTLTKRCLHGNPGGNAAKTITISPNGETTTTVTSFNMGNKQRTTTTTSSASTNATTEVDINGLTVSRTTPNSALPTRWEYTSMGEVFKEISPRGATIRNYYNPDGSLESTFDAAGKKTSYTYYAEDLKSAGKLHTVTNPLSKTTVYTYSDLGKVKEVSGTAAYKVGYDYDEYGAMTGMKTSRDNSSSTVDITEWTYQPGTGLLSSKKDAAAKITEYTYFASGKIHTRKSARNLTTTYSYTDFGDLSGIDYPNSTSTDYPTATTDIAFTDIDRLGRPHTVTQGDRVEYQTYHLGKGTPHKRYYASGHPLLPGRGISYDAPDTAGRFTGFTETSGAASGTSVRSVGYSHYEDTGNLKTVTDGPESYLYAYHPNSSLVQTIHSRTGTGSPTVWARETRYYDTPGRLTGIRSESMSGTTATRITNHSYAFDDLSRRTKNTLIDGSAWEYEYNGRSEVTKATRRNSTGTELTPLTTVYGYDDIGNRTSLISPVLGDRGYTPNSLNQYASITTSGSRTAVGRAPAGWTVQVNGSSASRIGEIYYKPVTAANTSNAIWRTVETTATDSSTTPATVTTKKNQFWYSKTSTTPAYDLDGNLTDDGRWKYVWDAENRLIQMEILASSPEPANPSPVPHPYTKLKFEYDWQGRRIARTVWQGGTSSSPTFKSKTSWLYDGWNVIAEFSFSSAASTTPDRINTFTWGLDLSGTLQGAGGVGGLLAHTTVPLSGSPVIQRASYDGNGNIVAWTRSDQTAPSGRREYDAFGNTVVGEGTWPNDFGFSTKQQDPLTGLYHYGYRYYDTAQGRWLSRDPIEEEGGTNLYGFVENNVVNRVDALGHMATDSDFRYITNYFAAAIVAATGDTLAGSFILHYASEQGADYKMTYQQAKKIETVDDIDVTMFKGINDYIVRAQKTKQDQKVPDLAQVYVVSSTYGDNALGNFDVHIKGKITCAGNQPGVPWRFVGTMEYKDRYDFNITGNDLRPPIGQAKTLAGRVLLAGKPFNVITDKFTAIQKASDNKLQW